MPASPAARARRAAAQGDKRRALMILRDACFAEPESARLWIFYAFACADLGRHDDAEGALRQAVWLRRRAGDARRAAVTQKLFERLTHRAPAA